nr:expressed protein [Hymenolepis microstoma]
MSQRGPRKIERPMSSSSKQTQNPRLVTYSSEQKASCNNSVQNQSKLTADALGQGTSRNTTSQNRQTAQQYTQQRSGYEQLAHGKETSTEIERLERRRMELETLLRKVNQEIKAISTRSARLSPNTKMHNCSAREEVKQDESKSTWMTAHETPSVTTQIRSYSKLH